MDERTRIADQLQRALEGDAWHGPAVLELLDGVTGAQAWAHPIPKAHSIVELVLHISAAYRLVLRRLQGDTTQLTPDEDWPPVPEPTEAHWRDAVDTLRALNEETRRGVLAFDASRLDEPLIETPPYTAWVQFVGLPQHDLYHAGQIALLKRALVPRGPLEPTRVAIVVAPDAGPLLTVLLRTHEVWVADTPENRAAAERVWGSSSNDAAHGLTTFKVSADEARDAWVADVLPVVDEHHGLGEEGATDVELEVHGVGITPRTRRALEALGSFVLHQRPYGFLASRR